MNTSVPTIFAKVLGNIYFANSTSSSKQNFDTDTVQNAVLLMQPSMSTLNSPSSWVVKDWTPSRGRILRYINFGIGESSPMLFLGGESSTYNI